MTGGAPIYRNHHLAEKLKGHNSVPTVANGQLGQARRRELLTQSFPTLLPKLLGHVRRLLLWLGARNRKFIEIAQFPKKPNCFTSESSECRTMLNHWTIDHTHSCHSLLVSRSLRNLWREEVTEVDDLDYASANLKGEWLAFNCAFIIGEQEPLRCVNWTLNQWVFIYIYTICIYNI